MDELMWLDATEQALLVRRREVTPLELVEAAITRIERLNPLLNAVVTPMFEQARAIAARPLPQGPFGGVPFLLKDYLAEYAGVPLTEGSAFLAGNYISPRDSELVTRLKHAGLIVAGKTNTSELAILPTSEPRQFGPARNPWDTARTTGGSSGGSAAAVAAGMVPMAHANDAGGSIRIPASCCGLFGLKPTRGRNSLAPYYGDLISGLVTEHAVTRSVRDSAALLDATAGPALGDPCVAPFPERPFLEEVGRDPGRLRIAFSSQSLTGTRVHPDCVTAVLETAKLCETLGHELTESAPAIDGRALGGAFVTMYSAGGAWAVADWARRTGQTPTPDRFETLSWAFQARGAELSAVQYLLAVQDGQRIAREVASFFEEYDCWLTPVLAEPPLPLGSFDSPEDDPTRGLRRAGSFAAFTYLCNVTGQPAMSLPLFWTADGLPVGSHFAARFGDEATLFRLAAQLEQARPWAARRPPAAA